MVCQTPLQIRSDRHLCNSAHFHSFTFPSSFPTPTIEMEDDDEYTAAPAVVDDSPSAGFHSCPACNTTKVMQPKLQLLFSTCCGLHMCNHCIDGKFRANSQWVCGLDVDGADGEKRHLGCGTVLTKKSWDPYPLDEQRFKSEVANRAEANKIFNLERVDFPSDEEFNQYLEEYADIIFGLTYGNPKQKKEAEEQRDRFKRVNKERIDRSNARAKAAHTEAIRLEREKHMSAAEREAQQKHAAAAQSAQGGGGLWFKEAQKEEDSAARPRSFGELEATVKQDRAALWRLVEQRRVAGGFKREVDAARIKQDAMDGLWL